MPARTLKSLFASAGLFILIAAGALAQGTKPLAEPESKSLATDDGGAIKITYYLSPAGKESPVVVLLHMKNGNRLIWQGPGGFATRLQREGYAVITVDLRYHGESRAGGAATTKATAVNLKPVDYESMVGFDMEAVKKFIYSEHIVENLNMNKTGIVGPEMGATIAAFFAWKDWLKDPYPDAPAGFQTPRGQDIKALVLMSPQMSTPGLPIAKAVGDLRAPAWNLAVMLCYGKGNGADKSAATKLYEQFTSFPDNKNRMYLQEYPGGLRGTELLGRGTPKPEDHMLGFLNEHLKKLPGTWVERRPKFDRPETK